MQDQIIGNYKITGIIGEGGMGKVFKGIDLMLEREVAIKSLSPEYARRPDIVERFRREVRALATLNHPNIVTVYNFFRQGDDFFIVTEFVDGETLDKMIAREKAIPCKRAVPLFCQALRGIGHAHSYGIIHRDIKPTNMIITQSGLLKVMDFGIARVLLTGRLAQQGHLVGTAKYMSPEQIQGRDVDTRSDIYSLGIVLYEMLAGRTPFAGDSEYELLRAQIEEAPRPVRQLAPDVPPELEALIAHALAKTPEKRFQSAAEFRTELERIMEVTPPLRDSWQIPLALSETGIETPLPYSRDLLSDSGIAPPESRKSLPNYIKRHSGAVFSIVVVIGVAILIGIDYRLRTQATLQEPSGAIQQPTVTASSQEPPAAMQPQAGPLPPPKAVTTDQPTPAKEPPRTTTEPETVQQQPIILRLEAPKAETAKKTAPQEQPSQSPSAPIAQKEEPKPETAKKTAPRKQPPQSKSKPKPRTSAGSEGSGGWKIIYDEPKPETAEKTARQREAEATRQQETEAAKQRAAAEVARQREIEAARQRKPQEESSAVHIPATF